MGSHSEQICSCWIEYWNTLLSHHMCSQIFKYFKQTTITTPPDSRFGDFYKQLSKSHRQWGPIFFLYFTSKQSKSCAYQNYEIGIHNIHLLWRRINVIPVVLIRKFAYFYWPQTPRCRQPFSSVYNWSPWKINVSPFCCEYWSILKRSPFHL